MDCIRIGPCTIPIAPTSESDEHGSFHSRPCPHIEIDESMTGLNRPMAILHEALHAVSFYYHVNLSERDVRTLEMALTALIRDNPKLVSDLQR